MPTIYAIALILAVAVFDAAGFSSLGGDRSGGFISDASCASYKSECTTENEQVALGMDSSLGGTYACTTFASNCEVDCTCVQDGSGSWTCSCPRCTPQDTTYTTCTALAAECSMRYANIIASNGYLRKSTDELKAAHLNWKMHDARFTNSRAQACRDFRGATECCDNLASYTSDWQVPGAIDNDPCDAVADQLTTSRTINYLDDSTGQCVYGATQTQTRTCDATGKGDEVTFSTYSDFSPHAGYPTSPGPCPVGNCDWGSSCCMEDSSWFQYNSVNCNALQLECTAQGVSNTDCIESYDICPVQCKTFMEACGAYCAF